MDSSSRRLRS